jgi:hypothetical protein
MALVKGELGEKFMTQVVARRGKPVGPIRGDIVRVRTREEILSTLDSSGDYDSLPFMPEMLEFCGQELTVTARGDKVCDTVNWSGLRQMRNTVFLTGTRCSGSAHGGCQAGCNLFWRQEWLEWADTPGEPISLVPPAANEPGRTPVTIETLTAATKASLDAGETAYRCQATQHFDATFPLPRHYYRQYINDVRTKNVTIPVLIRGLLVFAFNHYQRFSARILPNWLRIRGGRMYPFIVGTGTGERTPTVGLKAGDLVEVKSKAEIMATLDSDQRNRGMWFDAEMLPYIGRRARVKASVTRILDESSGKMVKLRDCVVLEDVVCMGLNRGFCQRSITPYWREAWLRRIDEPAEPRRT